MARFPITRRRLALALAAAVMLPILLVLLFRVVPPPATPLMLIRLTEGEGIDRQWKPLDSVSPSLIRAVIASEDAKFCRHSGFDWEAIDKAIDRYGSGGRVLGASTISMQTAKNLFLWPGRDFVRKGFEAGLTVLLETFWSKDRIMEVYLNIVEWGPGIYGAEAAARHYYGKPAKTLTQGEAAALAAVLPSPRRWSPTQPTRLVRNRIRVISQRMNQIPAPSTRLCP